MTTNNLPVLRVDEVLPDKRGWTNRIEIKSSSGPDLYIVSQNIKNRHWGCSCKGWIFHGTRRCKHLKAIAKGLGLPEETLCGEKPFEMQVIGKNQVASLPSSTSAKPAPKAKAPAKKTRKPKPATVVAMPTAKSKKGCCGGCSGDVKKLRERLVRLIDLSEMVSEEGLPEFTALENEIEGLRTKIRELRAAV